MSSFETKSVGSKASSRTLLFGEIDVSSPGSLRSNGSIGSICNLTFSTSALFLKFWLLDRARESFLSSVSSCDLSNLRLVCHDFDRHTAPLLFANVEQTFRASTFSRPSRVASLERIGHHLKRFDINMTHSWSTALPPLIDRDTGQEVFFTYSPRPSSRDRDCQFGSSQVAELLMDQYPPLFHAATNVHSFLRAFLAMPNLVQLHIRCNGEEVVQQCRRSIIDYVLISLRVALERAPLEHLKSLSLNLHSDNLVHLQPSAFGAGPRATRRWARIENIDIALRGQKAHDMDNSKILKPLHAYLRSFPALTSLKFTWVGERGPFPILLVPPKQPQHSPTKDPNKPLDFPSLRNAQVFNALVRASQISSFISAYRRTLTEINFEDVKLVGGSWDDALEPLTRMCGHDHWKRPHVETMEVPLIFSPSEPQIHTTEQPEPDLKASRTSLYRWLTRARTRKGAIKCRGQSGHGSEHLKKLLHFSGLLK